MNRPRRGRRVVPSDVVLPASFEIEVLTENLNFPMSLALGPNGEIFVAEAGRVLRQPTMPARIVQVHPSGAVTEISSGFNGTITSLAFRDGRFYVAESDWPARIVRVNQDKTKNTLVTGLPGGGDHPTNGIVFGPDGNMYFGQGTVTNSGVVGIDNFEMGWLAKRPDARDIPGQDIRITPRSYTTANPLSPVHGEQAATSPFVPFDTSIANATTVSGSRKCSGSIIRSDPEGDNLELVAWGFRETFGIAFSPDGRLFCTENGMEERGSRPVRGDVDRLWEVKEGTWYGWPDFAGGEAVTDPKFKPLNGPPPQFLIEDHPPIAGPPLLSLSSLSGIARLDFCPPGKFGFEGQAFIALAGDFAPHVPLLRGTSRGCRIVRVDIDAGHMETFISNRHDGPASAIDMGGLERPVDVKFDPRGEALYVLDYGIVDISDSGPRPVENTGVLWRIRRHRVYTMGFGGPM